MSKKISILLLLLVTLSYTLISQNQSANAKQRDIMLMEKNPVGTEYYITFPKNYTYLPDRENTLIMKLFITAIKDANVTIEIPAISFKRELFIPANETKNYTMPGKAEMQDFTVRKKGAAIHITSDMPIYVYGLSTRSQTTDSYLAFPSSVLGKEYRILSYRSATQFISEKTNKPEFSIIAIKDSTDAIIIPTIRLADGTEPGDTLKIRLDQGDVYQTTVHAKQPHDKQYPDLTGTYIKTNNEVAVFAAHECAYVPLPAQFRVTCNHLVEQVPPIISWGKHFFLGKFAKRSSYVYRILADEDSTSIFINSRKKVTLNAGEFFEQGAMEEITVSADKPILVAQYSEGYANGDNIGDPMMLYISPTNQFLKQYYFSTPSDGDWYHYINLVVPTKAIKSIRLDGKALEQTIVKDDENSTAHLVDTDPSEYIKNKNKKSETNDFRRLGNSRYSIGSFRVPYGAHVIACTHPFGMYSYGFGTNYDAYGTMGGQSFKEYVFVPDELPPYAETSNKKDRLNVVVYDDRDDDSGLFEVVADELDNIKVDIQEIELGLPYALVKMSAINKDNPGRARLIAKDMEGNVSEYTICYIFNDAAGKYVFNFQEGYSKFCTERQYEIGAFFNPQLQMHKTDFQNVGEINTPAKFDDDISTAIGFGIYASKKIKPKTKIAIKLFLDNTKAYLNSTYPEISEIRNPDTGEIEYISEAIKLDMKAMFLNYNAEIEYYLDRRIYVKAGLGLAMNISENSKMYRYMIDPSYYYNDDIIIEGTTGIVNSYRFYGLAGIGFSQTLPVMNEYLSIFSEILYTHNFQSYLKNDDWKIRLLTLNVGLKYSL